MDMKDKRLLAGQMMMVGFSGVDEISEDFINFIEEYKIGNVILFSENIYSANRLKKLCDKVQQVIKKVTDYPALISIDQEGGMVSRFSPDLPASPGAMAIGRTGKAEYAYESGLITAKELKMCGVNFNLAPSCDINNNKKNPVIGVRSYGEDADTVYRFAKQMADGLKAGGVIPCIKHFPGHGNTNSDSHLVLPSINKSLEELEEVELFPFKKLIEDDIEAVMTSHIIFKALDSDYPCTMSKTVLTDLLRDKLGFDGLIVTDCLEMGAIKENYGSVKGGLKAVEAGADLLCVSHNFEVARDILDAVIENIDTERLKISAEKIIKLKERYLVDSLLSHKQDIDSDELAKYRTSLSRMRYNCIDVRNKVNDESLRPDNKTVILGCPSYRATLVSGKPIELNFAEYLGEKLNLPAVKVPLEPTVEETEEILAKLDNYSHIIMGSYNAHLLTAQGDFVKSLEAKTESIGGVLTLAALRNPYDLELVSDKSNKIALYEYSTEMFDEFVKFLKGGKNE